MIAARNGVLAVDHTLLAGFLAALAIGSDARPPASAATLQRKAACLRSFYRHLRRDQILEHDPTASSEIKPARSTGVTVSGLSPRRLRYSPNC